MRREFSAGGVVVRRLRGGWCVAAIRPAGQADGRLGAPEGADRRGRDAGGDGGARGREETGSRRASSRSSATSATSTPGTASGSSRSSASSSSATGAAGWATLPPEHRHEVAEARWLPLDEAPRLLAYRASARWPEGARSRSRTRPYMIVAAARVHADVRAQLLLADRRRPAAQRAARRRRSGSATSPAKYRRAWSSRCSSAPASARASRSSTP